MDELHDHVVRVDTALQVHLAICEAQGRAMNAKLNWMLAGMGLIALLSFMGPHDGIMGMLAKLKG
jgi:hypothetical protein